MELTCPNTCTCLFKLRPGVLSKTLSHMWGKLNLPMFLFNVGLLTLIKMDSLIFLVFQFSLRPDDVHSSGWKLVYNHNQSSVPEKIYLFTSRDNRMRNLHKIILEQHGMEGLQLFKDWERFKLRDCDYRNHRIFTPKWISSELVPVSLRLKTTIKTERARKIIRKAEKDLLQARVKSINSILGDNAKQRELSRSKLPSLVSTSIMDKCQQFIDKASEHRYLKLKKDRLINLIGYFLKSKEI